MDNKADLTVDWRTIQVMRPVRLREEVRARPARPAQGREGVKVSNEEPKTVMSCLWAVQGLSEGGRVKVMPLPCNSRTAVGWKEHGNADGGGEGDGIANELQTDAEPAVRDLDRPPAAVGRIEEPLVLVGELVLLAEGADLRRGVGTMVSKRQEREAPESSNRGGRGCRDGGGGAP